MAGTWDAGGGEGGSRRDRARCRAGCLPRCGGLRVAVGSARCWLLCSTIPGFHLDGYHQVASSALYDWPVAVTLACGCLSGHACMRGLHLDGALVFDRLPPRG